MLSRFIPRTVLASLLTLLAVAGASAQRHYSPNFAIGGKAGATVSMMSFSPKVQQAMLPGFMAGVTVRYTEEKLFGLIAELNVEQRGWRENYSKDAPESGFSYRRTLTYVQIPLLTHIRFGSDRVKAFVNLGPEVGYMVGNSISANFNYRDISSVAGYPTRYRTNAQLDKAVDNRFDYGISGGIGMEVIFGRHSMMVEGRYYFGLGNIFSASKSDYFSASRGMSIEITAAYLFRLR